MQCFSDKHLLIGRRPAPWKPEAPASKKPPQEKIETDIHVLLRRLFDTHENDVGAIMRAFDALRPRLDRPLPPDDTRNPRIKTVRDAIFISGAPHLWPLVDPTARKARPVTDDQKGQSGNSGIDQWYAWHKPEDPPAGV